MFLIDFEHPPRHIHIKYGEHEAVMELMNLNIVEDHVPTRCRQLVREGAELHQDELIEMWDTQNFHRPEPLEGTMKLASIEHKRAYRFVLIFQNGEVMESDLRDLIGPYVTEQALSTGRIDPDWGCLEFLGGQVDIEPRTLYRYARGVTGKPITNSMDATHGHRTDIEKEENAPCS